MKLKWWFLLTILGGNALYGGAITSLDISTATKTTVHTGDTLVFHLYTWNFARNAASFNLPAFPADLNFALVTAPLTVEGKFSATLESEDGSVSAAFGELTFSPGGFHSTSYSGEVSTLQGFLHLAPQLSQPLFESGSIAIVLRNLGPTLELGISDYALRQDMFVSLSTGSLSVGALPGWVELEEPRHSVRLNASSAPAPSGSRASVPEPGSKLLLLGGGLMLCAFSALLGRLSQRRG